ncbi:MAG: nitroreductase family protein [Desulfobacteraceae bacterium]|nr:nitroreductase family protein [Desulfobacteraceae bacterium]
MFFELIRNRRSSRSFEDKKIDSEIIDLIKEAALRAPSSRSLNPWEFIFSTDQTIIEKLSRAKTHGSSFLKSAALAVTIAADPKKCDVWIEDSAIASIYIQLACEALGLKSCWCQIRKREHDNSLSAEDYVKQVLGIPENLRVLSIIGTGFPAGPVKGHDISYVQNQLDKIHTDKF